MCRVPTKTDSPPDRLASRFARARALSKIARALSSATAARVLLAQVDFPEFVAFNRKNPTVLYPAFRLQERMQRMTLGTRKWTLIMEAYCHARAVEAAAQAARDAKDLGEDAPAPHKLAWYNRGAALLVRRKLGATRFGSVQTKYVDAARPHFRKKIAKQEKEAAAIAANLAAGLTADGRAK